MAGQDYWATPGGGLDQGESFEEAATRELREETGIQITHPGQVVSARKVTLQLPDGQWVLADERYFLVRIDGKDLASDGWTDRERRVISEYKWWSMAELETTSETIWPDDLPDILGQAPTGVP